MALKKFNSVEGFSVGSPGNVIDVVDNFANVYANRIFVEQYANLGDVGNVYIGGGTNNQVLKTDGAGGLFWALDTAPAGGNTTEIQFNDAGSLGASSAFTFDKISNVLSISGNITSDNANLGNLVTANYFSGNGSLLTSIDPNNIDGQVANALVSGTVYANAQPNITSVGTLVDTVIGSANSLTGANLLSATYLTGTLTTQSQLNITSVGSLSTLEVLGNITSANASLGNLVTANYFSGNGSLLTGVISTANYAAYAGNVTLGDQPNITAVGDLTSLVVTGVANVVTGVRTANIQGPDGTVTIQTEYNTNPGDVGIHSNLTVGSSGTGNLTVNGISDLGPVSNVTILGGSANYMLITDGAGSLSWASPVTEVIAGTDTQVQFNDNGAFGADGNFTYNKTTDTLNIKNLTLEGSGTANLGNYAVSNYFSGDGRFLTNITGANVTSEVGTANIAWRVSANDQPNVTSLGTLSGLNVTGDSVFTGNVTINGTNGNLSVTNLTVQDNIIDISAETLGTPSNNAGLRVIRGDEPSVQLRWNESLTTWQITNDGTNYLTIVGKDSAGNVIVGNLSATNLTGSLITAAQPNITSVGTLVDANINGNVLVGGNLTVNGTTYYTNVDTLAVEDPIIEQGGGPNASPLTNNDGKDRGSLLHYYTTKPVDAFMGWDNSNGEFAFGSNVSVSGEVVTFNDYGNLHANYFIGNGSQLTGIIGTSNYAAYAGNVVNSAQPNITSVGTLVNTTMGSGNSLSGGNLVSATYLTGTLTTKVQPNITSVGTLVDTTIGSANSLTGGNLVSANYFTGTLTTNAQPNITSVGVLSSLSVSANITSGNATLGNLVTANYFAGDGSQLTNLTAGTQIRNGTSNVSISSSGGNATIGVNGTSNVVVVSNDRLTLTGNLYVSSNILRDNKNVSTYVSSTSAPTNPVTGDQWYDQVNDVTYQYIYDGTSYFWVDISSGYVASNVNAIANTLVLRNSFGNIYANGLFANTLNIAGISNLGPVGNLIVTGGTSGQYLQTDGAGNLSWSSVAAGSTSNISNGTSNVNAGTLNGNVTVSVGGTANTVVFTGTGVNVAGYVNTGTGNITGGNLISNGSISATGTISGNNLSISYDINTVGGNISSAANILASGNIVATANIQGGNITSSGALSVIGTATVGNLNTTNGNLTGNLLIGGNLIVNGATEYTNVTNLYVKDPIIEMGGNANAGALTSNDGKDRGTLLHYYTTQAVDAFMGWDNSNGEFAFGSNVSVSGEVVTFNSFGNVRANNFIGNISQASGINASNIASGTIPSSILGNSSLYVGTTSIALNRSSGSQTLTGVSIDGSANYATYAGTVTTNAQPNITSVGTLSQVSVTANVTAGNVKTDNLLYANGVAWSFGSTYSNANVATYLPTYTGNFTAGNVSATGNITAAYFIGNGSQLTGLPESYSNVNVAAYLPTYTGNISANVITSNTVTVGAGTGGSILGANVVSANYFVGDGSLLTGLPASYSNVNVAAYLPTYTGELSAANITSSANVTALYFIGNGSALTHITGANVDGTVPLATSATTAGTVTTAAQPNITSLGTLVNANIDGNLVIGGNLTVNGTTTYVNVDSLKVEDPIIEMGGGPNGDPLTTNDNKDRGTLLHYYTTKTVDAFMGWDNSNGEFAFGSNVSVSGEIVTFNSFGNVRADNFIGNLSQATGLNASNLSSGTISSTILGNSSLYIGTTSIALNRSSGSQSLTGISIDGSANYATFSGTVTTNAQPNITSVGTLSSLSVTANVSAGNILTDHLLYANGVSWDLGGAYANSNVQAYLPTYTGNLSPSNLVVSTSANLGAVGNIYIGGGSANYVLSTNGSGSLAWVEASAGGTEITVDNFTGDGSTLAYTLSIAPTDEKYTIVSLGGTFQPRTTYTVSGTTLTFSSAPPDQAPIEVTIFSAGSGGGGSGTGVTYANATANLTAVANTTYFVNTSTGPKTITLPASPTFGMQVGIIDCTGNASSNNITIARNSSNIQGAASDMTVSVNRGAFTLAYFDATQGWLLTNV